MRCNYYNYPFPKLQRFFLLFLLQQLIPADGHFEASLSLALDRALVGLEGTA